MIHPRNLAALRLLIPPNAEGSVTVRASLFVTLLDELEHLRAVVDGFERLHHLTERFEELVERDPDTAERFVAGAEAILPIDPDD